MEPRDLAFDLAAAWQELSAKIRRGDPAGYIELQRIFLPGVRYLLGRHFTGAGLEERIEAVFSDLRAVIGQEAFDPATSPTTLVRTIMQRHGLERTDQNVIAGRKRADLDLEKAIATLLKSLSLREREALVRFYLHRQEQSVICVQMNLSEAEFKHIKTHAKAVFARALEDLRAIPD